MYLIQFALALTSDESKLHNIYLCLPTILSTSKMIHHHEVSLSKQCVADLMVLSWHTNHALLVTGDIAAISLVKEATVTTQALGLNFALKS